MDLNQQLSLFLPTQPLTKVGFPLLSQNHQILIDQRIQDPNEMGEYASQQLLPVGVARTHLKVLYINKAMPV